MLHDFAMILFFLLVFLPLPLSMLLSIAFDSAPRSDNEVILEVNKLIAIYSILVGIVYLVIIFLRLKDRLFLSDQ